MNLILNWKPPITKPPLKENYVLPSNLVVEDPASNQDDEGAGAFNMPKDDDDNLREEIAQEWADITDD